MITKKKLSRLPDDPIIELNKRVGVIISLLIRMVPEEKPSMSFKDQVGMLADFGLRPRDIAAILRRTPTHVNKELTGLRKDKKSNPNKNKNSNT